MIRSLRVGDLYNFDMFEQKLRANLASKEKRFGVKFEYPSYRGAPVGPIDIDKEGEFWYMFALVYTCVCIFGQIRATFVSCRAH